MIVVANERNRRERTVLMRARAQCARYAVNYLSKCACRTYLLKHAAITFSTHRPLTNIGHGESTINLESK